ncbi:MAG: hypothetical protein DHS80DRAFT_21374 [Piptocephalis tieghemiana]|nr:MAG: hypothetical protein DHS80DRAFT_21374 [Piptocephalis tieghemiana]
MHMNTFALAVVALVGAVSVHAAPSPQGPADFPQGPIGFGNAPAQKRSFISYDEAHPAGLQKRDFVPAGQFQPQDPSRFQKRAFGDEQFAPFGGPDQFGPEQFGPEDGSFLAKRGLPSDAQPNYLQKRSPFYDPNCGPYGYPRRGGFGGYGGMPSPLMRGGAY